MQTPVKWVLIVCLSFGLSACPSWLTKKNASPSQAVSPIPSEPALSSESAKQAKAHAEILREMYAVVLLFTPKDVGSFGNWVDSLNQGASLEGVYNSFTHSSLYRDLEKKNRGAKPEAVKAFARELARLIQEDPQGLHYETVDAEPFPTPLDYGSLAKATKPISVVEEVVFEKSTAGQKPKKRGPQGEADLAQLFKGASWFTLKRVLADRALDVLALQHASLEKRAEWYADQVVHWASLGVDFGLEQRNQADRELHRQWALKNSDDRLVWEVLNRLHRIINHAQQN